jgi:hypothetical protein
MSGIKCNKNVCSMGDRKAGIKQKVLLIKDTLALIHRVGSNPKLPPVTTAK